MAIPQPPTSWRDLAWAAVGAAAVAWFVKAIATATLVVGLLLVVAGFFVVAGAWRRTIWGCPFSHDPDDQTAESCPRHPPVPSTPQDA